MDTSVEMQEAFSCRMWPVTVGVAVLLIFAVLFLVSGTIAKRRNRTKKKIVYPNIAINLSGIKQRYLAQLCELQRNLRSGKVEIRVAYQAMSGCIRDFVYEVTGIKVTNYTLNEIRELHMPVLEELISEFYEPEFAIETAEDGVEAIEKTKRTIERWR